MKTTQKHTTHYCTRPMGTNENLSGKFVKNLLYIISFLLLAALSTPTTAQSLWSEDLHLPDDTLQKTTGYSYFGGVHTPRGNLHVLVLTIGFDRWDYEGDSLILFYPPPNDDLWPVHSSDNVVDFQGFPKDFHEVVYSSPDMFSPTANDRTVSNFYYQHSRTGTHEPFKVTYEFFPHRINIPILDTDVTGTTWSKFINRAYDTIQARYADFDWQRFDTRTNRSGYEEYFENDNSLNPLPDGKLDYVIILARFGSGTPEKYGWIHDKTGSDAVSSIIQRHIIKSTGDTITFTHGFRVYTGIRDHNKYRGIILHEDAHTFYDAPHVYQANNVVGQYFYTGGGWAGIGGRAYYSQNAWDRWWLDWIEIKHDLSCVEHNGDYWLEDFITTGDAMRLELPTPDGQHVWFENRTGHTIFDQRLGFLQDGVGHPIPPASFGIIGFVEAISNDQT